MTEHVCSLTGCDNAASRYPKVQLKPAGKTWGECEPAVLIVPLPVCLLCQPKFDAQDFLAPEARQRLRVALMERGKAMPDFDNPAVLWAHIGDKDWLQFHALQAKAG